MNTAAPAEVRILLEPSSITPAEQDAAHASPYYVKLQHEGVARFGTAIVTDDHRVVVEIENGEMYTMQLTSDAAARLRTALETWTKGDDDATVELDPPNTYRGVGIVAEHDGPAPGSVLAEVRGQGHGPPSFVDCLRHTLAAGEGPWNPRTLTASSSPIAPTIGECLSHLGARSLAAQQSVTREEIEAAIRASYAAPVGGFTPPTGPASPGPALFMAGPARDVYETGDAEVDELVAEGLAGLPDEWPDKARVHGPMLAAVARMVIAHTPAGVSAEGFVLGQAEVDNLQRAELVPLDVQIEAALRLVAEARAGEGDGACKQCGHPVVQRRLASIQHALEQMRTLPGEVDGGCTGDVFPTAHGAVSTEFLELFYIAGHRVGLRFEGLPDIYIAEADTQRLARAVFTGNDEITDALRACHILPTIGKVGIHEVAAGVQKLRAEYEARGSKDELVLALRQIVRMMQRLRGRDMAAVVSTIADVERIGLSYIDRGDVAHDAAATGQAVSRSMLMGPEPADNIRIKVRLDWQDPAADARRLFIATEGARGALMRSKRVAEPEPAVELVLPFEAHEMLVTAEGGALLERLRAEFPFVVAVQERGLPSYDDAAAELQTIAERVGPAIGEGQIATQTRKPGEVARAVRTLVERSGGGRTEARRDPGQRIMFDGEEFMLPTMLAADYLAADDGDFEGRLLIVLRGAAELHKQGGAA